MAAAKQKSGGWGGLIFAAVVATIAYAPAFAGIAVVLGILWLVFASNAKFNLGNNPWLMQTGQRGQGVVAIATRSQVRSRSGGGPWVHTWTIVLDMQPPQSAGYRATVYRKLPQNDRGPEVGQRLAVWFAPGAPQTFHIDWARGAAGAPVQETPRHRAQQSQPRPQPQRKPARTETTAYTLPQYEAAPLPMVEADGGFGFDFAAKGADGRARIDDFGSVDDGSTEIALTVMPRRGAPYRTIINTFVPDERRHRLARGLSLQVRLDPSAPGRLMIVG